MKLKTNKLLTLTLASSLVAITAGCGGGTKAAAPTGTTPVVVPDPVTYTEWAAGTTIATDDTANAFLAGVAAIAGTGGAADTPVTLTGVTTGATVETLNLAYQVTAEVTTPGSEATAVTFGGAATNGVAFSATTGTLPADARYFAGVIAGADLGVPLTTTTAAGTWNGIFQAVGASAIEKSFVLTVNFTASQISGIVPVGTDTFTTDGDLSYFFVGDYDSDGVITGDIILRDLATDNDDDDAARADGVVDLTAALVTGAASPATDGIGTLSGLIGANGALGAFYSTANGALGYAGGFVALTAANVGGDNPNALYAKWSGSDDVTIATTLDANGFLASVTTDADGLVFPAPTTAPTVVTLNLASEVTPEVVLVQGSENDIEGTDAVSAVILGGAATDGVAFFTTGADATARYFAGLHFGTDLGAPITTDTGTADWNGLIQTVSGTPASMFAAKAFTLTVNFADSEVSAHVTTDAAGTDFGIASYYLTGEYDDAGVITGTVSYAIIADSTTGRDGSTANGVLSGLIGATEAVGAFYSNAEDATGYAGGFVATSVANAGGVAGTEATHYVAPVVNYADWVPSPALTAAATTLTTAPTANAFVHGVAAGLSLPATGITTANLNLATGSTLTGDAMDGVAFASTDANPVFYAGLINTTDLGAPLTMATAGGAWTGLFQAVGAAGYSADAKAFTLTVDFGTTAFNAHVAAGASTVLDASGANVNSYYLAGTFDAATGLMTGTIIRGDYSAGADADAARALAVTALGDTTGVTDGRGTVTGLIGQGGAIGAFISTATGATGYAGGFVANNP